MAKKSKNRDKATKKSKKQAPPIQRAIGRTKGLSIAESWAYIFKKNEKLPRTQKMTDEMIAKWMRKEFPGKDSSFFAADGSGVGKVRSMYRSDGGESEKYDEDGKVITRGSGSTGGKKSSKKKATKKKSRRDEDDDDDDDRPSKKRKGRRSRDDDDDDDDDEDDDLDDLDDDDDDDEPRRKSKKRKGRR